MSFRVASLNAACLILAAGCGSLYAPLPENPTTVTMPKPPGEAKTYAWHAESEELRTYWGRQRIKVKAAGTFPENWREPGDEAWEVKASNHEGKNVPFLGVLWQYKDKNGKECVEVRPPFEVSKMKNGLYLFIESRVELGPDKKIAAIKPQVHVREIRDSGGGSAGFTPYWVDFPLIPDAPTDITPMPSVEPPPKGTLIPK